MRAWEYNKALFDTEIDEYRMFIFDDHREYYRWYEGEVKERLAEVWDELHHTKPAWLTEELIKTIPLDLIPHIESVKEELGNKLKGRRRSSVRILGEALKTAADSNN